MSGIASTPSLNVSTCHDSQEMNGRGLVLGVTLNYVYLQK